MLNANGEWIRWADAKREYRRGGNWRLVSIMHLINCILRKLMLCWINKNKNDCNQWVSV